MKKTSMALLTLSSLITLTSCGNNGGSSTNNAGAVTPVVQNVSTYTTSASDNFNRADGMIGPDWVSCGVGSIVTPMIQSNRAVAPLGSVNALAYNNKQVTSSKVRLSMNVSGLSTPHDAASLVLDNDKTLNTGYIMATCHYADVDTARCHLWSGFNGGGPVKVLTGIFKTVSNALKMEALIDGTNVTLNVLDPNNDTTLVGSISYNFSNDVKAFTNFGLYLVSQNQFVKVDDFKIEEFK